MLLCLAICVLHSSVQQLLMLSSSYADEAKTLTRPFEGSEEREAMSEDEREVEQMFQRLKSVGRIDKHAPDENSGE